MKLIVGDISSWSMRAWVCMKLANVEFEELVIPLSAPGYRDTLARYSESMLVPVLDTGEVQVHDSLAIAEYCNEISGGALLPNDQGKRAQCRSLCSELHSGFTDIRTTCPFSWAPAPLTDVNDGVQREIDRLEYVWSQADGEYYYGKPTVADAFYSVMAYRLNSYNIVLNGAAKHYQQQLMEWPLFNSVLERARTWARTKA